MDAADFLKDLPDFSALTKGAPTGFKAPLSMAEFSPTAYKGDSPARRDIVAGRLPRGKVIILAGEGDIGKSWIVLELFHAINDQGAPHIFGGRVVQPGSPCIYLSGEDDRITLDLRLKTIRERSSKASEDRGLLIPAPDLGPMQLIKAIDGQAVTTDVFAWLDEQLQAQRDMHGELGFLAIDTFSTFFGVDANDNSMVQAALSHMTALAAKHDVCILILHHVAKGADPSTRQAIRGATALVDGSRGAYVFYRADKDETLRVWDRLDEDTDKGEVLCLKIVKNNLGMRRDAVTYVRQTDGSLRDVSDEVRDDIDPDDFLVQIVAERNGQGLRVTKTGDNGLARLKTPSWPRELQVGEKALRERIDRLLATGRLASERSGLVAVE